MLARFECPAKPVLADPSTDTAFPAESLQIEEVVNENRLAFLQKQAVAAEAAAQCDDHPLRSAFWDRYLSGDGEVLVQNPGSVAERNPGILTRVSKHSFPGNRARSRRLEAHKGPVIQGEDIVFRRLSQEQRL